MDLPEDFRDLLEEFASEQVDAVLVGGYAVAFHGRPRATKDIDLLLGPNPENLRRAAAALARFGAPKLVVESVSTLAPDDIVYMGQPPLRIDLMCRIDGVSTEQVVQNAVCAELDGLAVRVISLDDLISNKLASGRPQDVIDADYLRRVQAESAGK
ncbi:MAG: nucleotidyltransferase [Myxococcales bacterium]|nr:nucleotidyltransferase [Myxococcales bacterium]